MFLCVCVCVCFALQYPDAELMVAYGEFRGNFQKDPLDSRFVFYGMRYIIENFVAVQWTEQDVEQADEFYRTHGPGNTPFPFPKGQPLKHRFAASCSSVICFRAIIKRMSACLLFFFVFCALPCLQICSWSSFETTMAISQFALRLCRKVSRFALSRASTS